jgi:hypothetical protein
VFSFGFLPSLGLPSSHLQIKSLYLEGLYLEKMTLSWNHRLKTKIRADRTNYLLPSAAIKPHDFQEITIKIKFTNIYIEKFWLLGLFQKVIWEK